MSDAKTRRKESHQSIARKGSSESGPECRSTKAQPDIPRLAFFADSMLGKLTRWLRILGYDTAYEKDIPDDVMIDRVLGENRWLLTRDSYLAKRKLLRNRLTLLHSDYVGEQLEQLVVERLIDPVLDAETHCRCAECNHLVERISPEQAAQQVPAFVAAVHNEFAQCPGCKRVYWPGTHWDRICHELDRLKTQ